MSRSAQEYDSHFLDCRKKDKWACGVRQFSGLGRDAKRPLYSIVNAIRALSPSRTTSLESVRTTSLLLEAQCPRCGRNVPEAEVYQSWSGLCRPCRNASHYLRLFGILMLGAVLASIFAGESHAGTQQEFQRYADKHTHGTLAAVVVTRKFSNRRQLGSSEVAFRVGKLPVYRVVMSDNAGDSTEAEWQEVISHDMCHLEVAHNANGVPPRNKHGTAWRECAKRVGLNPHTKYPD